MAGLGAFGFWLALGIFLAAGAIAGALKERDKERGKQETLRALLSAKGESMPEVLAYLREKDAAEAARALAAWLAMGGGGNQKAPPGKVVAFLASIFIVMFTFIGGIIAMGEAKTHGASWQVEIGLMLGIWAGGFVIAAVITYFSRERKNGQPPGA